LKQDGEFSGWVPFEDPREWKTLPPGSTLIVDEAQNWFRPLSSRGNLPEYLTDMETIRHAGIRLILVTQHPTFLDTHIQKLVGVHEHLEREQGEEAARIYRRTAAMIPNVSSPTALAKNDNEKWLFPKDLYDAYTSAQVHKVKRVMKSKTKRALIWGGLSLAIFGYAWWVIWGQTKPKEKEEAQQAAQAAQQADRRNAKAEHAPRWDNAAAYARDHLPRIGMMPWTAPVYDNRSVTADPIIVCASSLPGEGANGEWMEATCTCFTEQGTLYDLSQPECRTIARRGPVYNPYKERRQEGVQGHSPADMDTNAPPVSAPAVAQMAGPQMAEFGGVQRANAGKGTP
jgi:hypothetical protein